MSDAFQASVGINSLTDTIVAVIPFVWVANRGSVGMDNMTSQLARALYVNSFQFLYMFSGDENDTKYVLPLGYHPSSGARVTALAETGYGVQAGVSQWKLVTSGSAGSGTVTSAQFWPITGPGADTYPGNGGYTSSRVMSLLTGYSSGAVDLIDEDGNVAVEDLDVSFVAYLGASDASVATNSTNQAVRLSFNGNFYDDTNGPANVYTGKYTFWAYEHLYSNGTPTGDAATFKNGLTVQLNAPANLGNTALRLSDMLVGRQYDGAVVGP